MKAIIFGAGFTVFVLFFGIALLDAFQNGQWIRPLFWLSIGNIFLVADNLRKRSQT